MYSIVLGQYTKAMKSRLEAEDKSESIETSSDFIELLKLVRYIVYDYESKIYPFLAIHYLLQKFYTTYHNRHESCNIYL